jgi:hypothetical protein
MLDVVGFVDAAQTLCLLDQDPMVHSIEYLECNAICICAKR